MAKNRNRRIVGTGLIAAIGFLTFAFAFAFAALGSGGGVIDQNAEENGGVAIAASAVTTSINYQGRLVDSEGEPLNGTYTVTFSLYEVASGGTALDMDTHNVAVEGGLFNTEIDFDQGYFDGRALWLGIKVGTDSEMTPRQELRPVPYALSLRSGAVINGSLPGPVLKVNTNGVNSDGVYAYTTGDDSEGFYAETSGDYSYGFYSETSGDYSYGFYAETSGEESPAVHAWSEGIESPAVYAESKGNGNESAAVYALSLGDGCPAVYAWSPNYYGVYGRGTCGGYFNGTSSNVTGMEVSKSYGVYAETSDKDSYGVYAFTSGDYSEGFYAYTKGKDSEGVYVETFGDDSEGVKAFTEGDYSAGVSANTLGKDSYGVYARTSGDYSEGVYAYTIGKDSEGVYVETFGDDSEGVKALTEGDYSSAVSAKASGKDSYGVYAYSATSNAIYADTGCYTSCADNYMSVVDPICYGLYTPDHIYTACGLVGPHEDVAEYFAVDEDVEAGTVMVIGENGKLQCSAIAYDTTVAGIVSTAPGVALGKKEARNESEELIAVAGRVPCRVDASYAPIEPGDLLTTSNTPGHGMKAQPVVIGEVEIYRPGTTLAKALEPLDSGTGTIEVLVTLQ
jgi:hypothetical protein